MVVRTGYRLSGVLTFEDRDLPEKWRCGVCNLLSTGQSCVHCKCARIAEWQGWFQPGSLLEYNSAAAIVTAIRRREKSVQIVVSGEETARIIKAEEFKPLAVHDERSQDFLNLCLCYKCDRVFKVQNSRNNLDKLRRRQVQTVEQLDLLRKEKLSLQKASPHAYKAILNIAAELKRLQGDLERLKRQLDPTQLWCPFCLTDLSNDAVTLDPHS